MGVLPLEEVAEHQADEQINKRLQPEHDVTCQDVAHQRNRQRGGSPSIAFTPVNATGGMDIGEEEAGENENVEGGAMMKTMEMTTGGWRRR